MIGELATYLKSSPSARVNLWLGPDQCLGTYRSKRAGFQQSNWTEICVGHLARENRCAAIVANYEAMILVKMLAAFGMMPPVVRTAETTTEAAGDPLTLFIPPSLAEEDRWAHKIAAAAGGHPWVIAGVNTPTDEDCQILAQVAASGAAIYWVTKWSSPVPPKISFGTKRVSGHDPDTFFAALLQALGSFPPGALAPAQLDTDPARALSSLLHSACKVFSDAEHAMRSNWLPERSGLPALSDEIFREQMERSRRLRPAIVTLGGENSIAQLVLGSFIAGSATGGRRADELYAWSWQAIDELPASARIARFDRSEYRIKILRPRARMRTADGAESFYEEGQRIIRALDKVPHYSAAHLYADWSEHKPLDAASLLIDQAVEILRLGRRAGLPDQLHIECLMLREHARRLPLGGAQRYLEAAKACAERYLELVVSPQNMSPQPFLNPDRSEGMREYHLGMTALDEAALFPDREDDLMETAEQYFQTMFREAKIDPVWVYVDWAVALGRLAQTRPGSRSAALYAEAYELLQRSADLGDSANLHTNWSAILLTEAKQTVGTRRDDLLDEAERRAHQAEALEAGKGLYNLASVAALRRRDQEVINNLRLCARYPVQPARPAFDRDSSFAKVREQEWFQDMVREIYPD